MKKYFLTPLLVFPLLVLTSVSRATETKCVFMHLGEKKEVSLEKNGRRFSKTDSNSRIDILLDRGQSTFSYYQYIQKKQNQYLLYQMTCDSTEKCFAFRLDRYADQDKKKNLSIIPTVKGSTATLQERTVLSHLTGMNLEHYFFYEDASSKKGLEVKCHD